MKQVLGGLFSWHYDQWAQAERTAISRLLEESERFEEKPSKSREYNKKRLRAAASRIVECLKEALGVEVEFYTQYLASKLLDPKVNLQLNQYFNNCQTFCNAMLAGPTFATIIPKRHRGELRNGGSPHYLLSFVSDYVGSKLDTENFRTTPSSEYIREFHIAEDMIEYFETWPSMPLNNRCSKLLLWPCIRDKACGIAQHMWLMPHETVSIIQLHICRSRHRYRHQYRTEDPKEREPDMFSDKEWFKDRLTVLLALDTFVGSAGAIVTSFLDLAKVLEEAESPREWKPKSAQAVGRVIREAQNEVEANFTIGKARKSFFPVPFSRDDRMRRHLGRVTIEKWRNTEQ